MARVAILLRPIENIEQRQEVWHHNVYRVYTVKIIESFLMRHPNYGLLR